jgi:hypothetical protein
MVRIPLIATLALFVLGSGRSKSVPETSMSDDRTKRVSPDRDRISLSEDYEVRDWAKSLGVSQEELRAAVEKVGNSARKLRAYIAERKRD